MRPIKIKEGTGLKRLNVNISEELHRNFKSATAAQGLEMTDVLLEFIQKYVDKNGQSELKQQRRVINDTHKRVVAVTKGLEKRAS